MYIYLYLREHTNNLNTPALRKSVETEFCKVLISIAFICHHSEY